MKKCKRCGVEKQNTKQWYCESCKKETLREASKKYYELHLEEERERCRQKNMREENVLRRKQKYENNKEEILEAQKRYRDENIEIVREKDRQKKARQRASGQDKIWSERRRARINGLPDTLTLAQWDFALAYWNNSCAICKRPFGINKDYTCAADHWIPITSEKCTGTIATNMIPLCHGKKGCNNSKTTKLPEEWLKRKFGENADALLSQVNLYFETVRKNG